MKAEPQSLFYSKLIPANNNVHLQLDQQLRKFASRGDVVHLKALLEKNVNPAGGYPFDLNARNPHNQYTAFHWACDSGHADCVEELVREYVPQFGDN